MEFHQKPCGVFRNVPSVRNGDIDKLKKMHPQAAQLVTCIQFPDEWTKAIDKFMAMGREDLSLHERLYQYYTNRRNIETLEIQMLIKESVDFYFPSEHLLGRVDPQ